MELIHNLLKLVIISKSIFRQVELCSVKQKFVAVDDKKCNNESMTLGCPAIDGEGRDRHLTMLGIFCQW